MRDWSLMFKSYRGSGVYIIGKSTDLSNVEDLATANGLAFFKVDLSEVANKEGFLRAVSNALEFPSYFGMNWDALEECLIDFEWHPAKGYVIMLRAVAAFSQKAPYDFKTARSIFRSAAKYWKSQKKPFFVLRAKD